MSMDRRRFLTRSAAAISLGGVAASASARDQKPSAEPGKSHKSSSYRGTRIDVSTYSFWQFRNEHLRSIETCIDLAADMGFDAVEILHRQMTNEAPDYLQRLKRRAFLHGLSLCGFSTHQTFLSPDEAVRRKNVEHTVRCIELAYQMGIPTMRVNTGTWGTSKNFDELMKNRGIEPPREGYTDENGFGWVIDGLTKCLPAAEKCGGVM